jgi:predicted permease
MIFLRRIASFVGRLFGRGRADRRMDDELREYVELSAADRIRNGMAPGEARRLARAELGNVEPVKERIRAARFGYPLEELGRDVRYGARLFVRSPGFTAVILLTLALGIGANTAIFSLIDALMNRALPARNPSELALVSLRGRNDLTSGGESLSYAMARALDAQRDVFAGAGGFTGMNFVEGAAGAVVRTSGGIVTGGFYETLELTPAAGRLLARTDDEAGAPLAAVISDGFWARRFARRPSVIGQPLLLNGVPVTIVGVTRPGFNGANVGQTADVTIAAAALPNVRPAFADLLGKGNAWLRVLARPARGVSQAAAAARLNAAWPALAESVISPTWAQPRRKEMAESVFVLEPGATGWTYLRDLYERPLFVLQFVSGLVLLIACANVASLFLARASTRRREIAVRLAIGAGRRRVVRQLVIEGLMLSCAGAAAGVAVAWLAGRLVVDLISSGPFQVVFDLAPNSHVLAFSTSLAVAAGVMFGLAPAMQSTRTEPSLALKDDGRTSTRRSRLLPSLVAAQVALSLVLVAGAGFFARTLRNLLQVQTGFSADHVLVASLERGKGPAPAALLDAVRRVPGVVAASVATHTPLDGSSWSEAIMPAGQPMPQVDNARIIGAGPRFLSVLQVRLVAGREFAESDRAGAAGVAVINQRYADKYFPNVNPLGRHLVSNLMGQAADLEIVGVAENTTASGLRRLPPPIVYVAIDQFGSKMSPSLAIRIASSPGVVEGVRSELQAQLPDTVVDLVPLSDQVSGTIVQERLVATLAGGFGALAVLLSSVGLYGLLAYSVTQRSKEIGIRMALGASGKGVVGLVVRDAATLVMAGVFIGVPGAWLASRAVSSMLFGLRPADPLTLALSVAVLGAAALVATYMPARRASRVDPLVALRHD